MKGLRGRNVLITGASSKIGQATRAGTEGMAGAVAFLSSDEAAYVTGETLYVTRETLYVDGGLTLSPAFRTVWSSE